MADPMGPDWRGVALAALSLLQVLVLMWMRQSSVDRETLRRDLAKLERDQAETRAHVGIDGNGIMARLDTIEHKLDRVVQELAEQRGASRGRL